MAERKTSKEVQAAENGEPTGLIIFTFSDDTNETFDLSKVPEALIKRLALHGASQKIGDSYASASADDNPLEFAKTATKETIAQLYAGVWRATGGGGGPRVNELAVALARVSGQELAECVEVVGAMSDDEKKVLRKKPKIAAALAQIAAEKAVEKAKKLAETAANSAD